MRPDFRLLHGHTISGLAYLNGTRLVKISDVFPLWNRQGRKENQGVDFRASYTSRNTDKEFDKDASRSEEERKQNPSKQHNSFLWSELRPHLFPRWLCQRWSSRWASGSVLMSVGAGSRRPAGIWVFHLIHLLTHMWPTEASDSGADKWHSAWS